jgi:FAD:protein FMN transferase
MPRFQLQRPSAVLLGLLLACAGCVAFRGGPTLLRFEFERPAMGTTFRLVFYAPDRAGAQRAARAAFERIEALDAALSDYDPGSELSRLSGSSRGLSSSGRVPASPDLVRVLGFAAEVSAATGGAFDVTVGPYVRLWRRAARQGELPSAERLAQARRSVGYRNVVVGPDWVELRAGDMGLDLGGIAKGYALDEALVVLARHGVTRALVDGGGDLAAGQPPPGQAGWRVALAVGAEDDQGSHLWLANGACATSGDAFRFVELGGKRYSHLVDPRSGMGLTHRRAATVLAPSGMEADAWASALCVLDPGPGLALVELLPGVEARIWGPPNEKDPARACDSPGFTGRMVR